MTIKEFLIQNDSINKVVELKGVNDNFSQITVASGFDKEILSCEVLSYKKKNTKKSKRFIIVYNGTMF
jgi:hypothetical protein